MKFKMLKLHIIRTVLLFCPLLVVLSCDKENPKKSTGLKEGYIVGTFVCVKSDAEGVMSDNKTERGFCILLEGSEYKRYPMNFYTFDITEDYFDFPEIIFNLPKHLLQYNTSDCGPFFFADSLWLNLKISFSYELADSSQKKHFVCGPCTSFPSGYFPWENYNQIILTEFKKID